MKIEKLNVVIGEDAKNKLSQTKDSSINGALACLETFYYSFNHKDFEIFNEIWLPHELSRLYYPLGSVIKGKEEIDELYHIVFQQQADVCIQFEDVVCYHSGDMAIFVGQDTGIFSFNNEPVQLQIRCTRCFCYDESKKQWYQFHHHGSIDGVSDAIKSCKK